MDKLLTYQIEHTQNIINILKNKNICLDGSDTGTGKTYVAMAVAKYMKLRPFIISPKTIMYYWEKIADIFGVETLGIVNYETITKGKYYYGDKRIKCPYITKSNGKFRWNLPNNALIIFDEVHRCNNENTYQNELLLSTKDCICPVLMLSATVVDNVSNFYTFGTLFKWYTNRYQIPIWLQNKKYNPKRASLFIREKLYPEYGSRISIADLGDKFPKRQICADCYFMEDCEQIDEAYKEIADAMAELKNKLKDDICNKADRPMVKILRARQKIELYKVPLFVDLAKQYLENNYSIVFFCNFTKTLELLAKELKTSCIIFGDQTIEERLDNIKNFMDNKEKIIICNIHSGSESISLHDQYGEHPRVSLISPTWSSNKLIQALGRTNRADSKSPSINRIIYCANTIEEKICNVVSNKVNNILTLNDSDLSI